MIGLNLQKSDHNFDKILEKFVACFCMILGKKFV